MEEINHITPIKPTSQEKRVRPFRKSDLCLKYEGMVDDRYQHQLLEEGINPLLLPSPVKRVEVTYLNKIYRGFGIKNRYGGTEFYCKDLPMQGPVLGPVTVNEPGVTLYPLLKGSKGRVCCVFMDWLDYMAYQTLIGEGRGAMLPTDCDCIILNDTRNFVAMLLDVDDYDQVYCFFPNSVIGGVMERTIVERRKERVTMMAYIYEGYLNLREYVAKTVKRTTEPQKGNE